MRETVLITGASSGIGKTFAFEYAGQGKISYLLQDQRINLIK